MVEGKGFVFLGGGSGWLRDTRVRLFKGDVWRVMQ